jgi:hypothetical protein
VQSEIVVVAVISEQQPGHRWVMISDAATQSSADRIIGWVAKSARGELKWTE